MVYGPEELIKKVTEQEKSILKGLEKKIDQHLLQHFTGEHEVYVDMDQYPQSLRRSSIEQLLNKYREQGWTTVKLENDQREEAYITFDYKPESNE